MDKLNLIVNNAGNIIANSKTNKTYLFDLENVENFIKLSTDIIISSIESIEKR